jgi:hypothetical protein
MVDWVFSGIGVEALKAVKRLLSNDNASTGHTAQGAKIADSPAQSGQGNYIDNSRIAIGTIVLPSQPNRVPDSEPPEPRHNIEYAGLEKLPIDEHPNGYLTPFPFNIVPYPGHVKGVVVGFTNDAKVGLTPKAVLAEGTIIYKHEGKEVARTTGQWLERGSGEIYMKVNRAFKLVLVLKNSRGHLFAPDMKSHTLRRGRVFWGVNPHNLGEIENVEATVKLTRVTSNECLFEGEFAIRRDPLEVTRIR